MPIYSLRGVESRRQQAPATVRDSQLSIARLQASSRLTLRKLAGRLRETILSSCETAKHGREGIRLCLEPRGDS